MISSDNLTMQTWLETRIFPQLNHFRSTTDSGRASNSKKQIYYIQRLLHYLQHVAISHWKLLTDRYEIAFLETARKATNCAQPRSAANIMQMKQALKEMDLILVDCLRLYSADGLWSRGIYFVS